MIGTYLTGMYASAGVQSPDGLPEYLGIRSLESVTRIRSLVGNSVVLVGNSENSALRVLACTILVTCLL